MLPTWVAYVTLVSLLLVTAARLAEHTVRTRRRWLWGAVLIAAPVLPLLTAGARMLVPSTEPLNVVFGPMAPVLGAAVRDLGSAASTAPVRAMEGTLLTVWVALSAVLVAFLALGVARVRQLRRRWRSRIVDGISVLVSSEFGPAVVGVLEPEIVVPAWVLGLDAEERALILAHEDEHRRRGDPALLASGFALAAMMPWNLPAWWALARLREAVETDCDARVLSRRAESRGRYARLLFDVGSRRVGTVPLGAGFGERVSSLERRLKEMLNVRPGRKRLVAQMAVAVVLVAAACTIEVNIDTKGKQAQEQQDVSAAPGKVSVDPRTPVFTPYTVAPAILNRTDVQKALERNYPARLKDAGIGGTVKVYFYIDAKGKVVNHRIDKSSGHAALDEAALRVADIMRFTPALNRDKKVPVWVSFPITFQVK